MDDGTRFQIDPVSGTVVFGDGEMGAVPPPGSTVGPSYEHGGGSAGNVSTGAPSALRRLLDEISWEGNARKYRGGGGHLENVVTTEVFSALDFLPRSHFLAHVLRDANGADAAREGAAAGSEEAVVDVLPGDLSPTWLSGDSTKWRIQPDALISSQKSIVYVEAKALSGGSFATRQMARSLHATLDCARGRTAMLLLVLDSPPPVRVRRLGVVSLRDGVEAGLWDFPTAEADRLRASVNTSMAWTTWDDIAASVRRSLASFDCDDRSLRDTVSRLAQTLISAAHPVT